MSTELKCIELVIGDDVYEVSYEVTRGLVTQYSIYGNGFSAPQWYDCGDVNGLAEEDVLSSAEYTIDLDNCVDDDDA